MKTTQNIFFTDLKLFLADTIHSFKWWKLVRFGKLKVNGSVILLIDITF